MIWGCVFLFSLMYVQLGVWRYCGIWTATALEAQSSERGMAMGKLLSFGIPGHLSPVLAISDMYSNITINEEKLQRAGLHTSTS